MKASKAKTPPPFSRRRLHSFAGFWFTLFLIEHLITNSQAALWITDDGSGFVHGVNFIYNLPYLPLIEIGLLAFPILIHMVLGINYLFEAAPNSYKTDGTTPALPQYPRNKAYTWQRITSWILLFLVVFHVIQMRFFDYPSHAKVGDKQYYMVKAGRDDGLDTLAERLGVQIYDQDKIETQKDLIGKIPEGSSEEDDLIAQKKEQEQAFLSALQERPIQSYEVIAVAPDFGTAALLLVRETFKMPLMIAIYTIFVLSACFHAFNGLWTFLITWGVSLTVRSQWMMRTFTTVLMAAIAFLGLSAVWLTFWVTLRN